MRSFFSILYLILLVANIFFGSGGGKRRYLRKPTATASRRVGRAGSFSFVGVGPRP
jgi:hypothetical protein